MGISLGDLAAVGALVVALMSPFSLVLYRTRRKLYETLRELEAAREDIGHLRSVTEALATSGARGLVATNACFDALTGSVHRILLNRSEEVDCDREVHQVRLTRRGVERAAAEARLFGSYDRIAQRSALQQLTFQLGDAATVELYWALVKTGGTDGVPVPDLEAAARELTRRLAG